MLDLGLGLNVWPWLWLVLAVVLVLLELTVLGGSFMVLPFGVSAFVAALLGFGDVAVSIQWIVFLVGGSVLFLLFWRYQTLVQRGNTLPPGVGAMRLVGLSGVVTRAIDPSESTARGRVTVEGESWNATTVGDDVIPEGARVRILEVEGTHVRVEPTGPDVLDHADARPDPDARPDRPETGRPEGPT